ncbi:hypothetical protein NicSoilB8_03200 [Arthrobacter sp. NicSoilB8]|nr:hypothetical protein NicSoilB8_03200 [Arthrobacter sp. NicSoilB8]
MGDEQGDQQRRSAVVQVRRPEDLVPGPEFEDGGDELEQGRFVVGQRLHGDILPAGDRKDVATAVAQRPNNIRPDRRPMAGHSSVDHSASDHSAAFSLR